MPIDTPLSQIDSQPSQLTEIEDVHLSQELATPATGEAIGGSGCGTNESLAGAASSARGEQTTAPAHPLNVRSTGLDLSGVHLTRLESHDHQLTIRCIPISLCTSPSVDSPGPHMV
jgi:hypothetical protein